jgi:hypothetical protein
VRSVNKDVGTLAILPGEETDFENNGITGRLRVENIEDVSGFRLSAPPAPPTIFPARFWNQPLALEENRRFGSADGVCGGVELRRRRGDDGGVGRVFGEEGGRGTESLSRGGAERVKGRKDMGGGGDVDRERAGGCSFGPGLPLLPAELGPVILVSWTGVHGLNGSGLCPFLKPDGGELPCPEGPSLVPLLVVCG